MNKEQKDKGLKRALTEDNGFRLPSNFAYRTMRKVEEAMRIREKRLERRTLLAVIAASICLAGCCAAGLILYFGDTLREVFSRLGAAEASPVQIPSFYLPVLIAIPLFLCFDRWMRKRYFERHS